MKWKNFLSCMLVLAIVFGTFFIAIPMEVLATENETEAAQNEVGAELETNTTEPNGGSAETTEQDGDNNTSDENETQQDELAEDIYINGDHDVAADEDDVSEDAAETDEEDELLADVVELMAASLEAQDETEAQLLKANASGSIEVDGNLEDWSKIQELTSNDGQITYWKVARDEEGNLYFCFTGTASSEWDGNYQWKNFQITLSSDTPWWYNMQIANVPERGGALVMVNEANGNTAAPYYVEAMIPAYYFTDSNFTVTLAGISVPASEIAVLDGEVVEPEPKPEPVYNGIVIDGAYDDWAGVPMYPAKDDKNYLDQVAMVFDGEWVYLYLKETPGSNAAGAGNSSNGKYAITTDLGEMLLFQLNWDDTISGIDQATVQHVGKEWEIAIPVSALPNYLSSINFGLYLEQPMITDVVNLDGSSNTGSFAGIVYDGLYGDWTYYPHTTVQYAGSGTQALEVDARGALYAEGSTVYGHFVTTMSSHLGEAGGEFTSAVSICFNGNLSWDQSKNFYPRFIAVDSQGNIDWNPQLSNLQVGQTYEFYLASLDAWGTSTNINNLNEHDQIYGKMMITIGETKDECEFYLDLQQVANKLDCDVSDLKRIDAQFGRLGQEWVTTAGASSGAAMGVLLCCTVTGGVWYRRKQKGAVQS